MNLQLGQTLLHTLCNNTLKHLFLIPWMPIDTGYPSSGHWADNIKMANYPKVSLAKHFKGTLIRKAGKSADAAGESWLISYTQAVLMIQKLKPESFNIEKG